MDTSKDIGNTLGEFIKVAEKTRVQRYTSFARIYIYLDLSKELLEAISLNWEDKEWIHPIDYEHIPFRCRHCHEYGHLGRNCPKIAPMATSTEHQPVGAMENDGFTQVKNKRRSRGGGASKDKKDQEARENRSKNSFVVLGDSSKGDIPKEKEEVEQLEKDISALEKEETQQMEIVEEEEDEEMELGELDLDVIKAECGKKGKGYVPKWEIELLQEAINKVGA